MQRPGGQLGRQGQSAQPLLGPPRALGSQGRVQAPLPPAATVARGVVGGKEALLHAGAGTDEPGPALPWGSRWFGEVRETSGVRT